MIKQTGLRQPYIQIRKKEGGIAYGGSQMFFDEKAAQKAEVYKHKWGCGIIAFADLLLYLGQSDKRYLMRENAGYVNRELSEAEYKSYFDRLYDFVGGLPHKGGISGLKLAVSFNRMAAREGWSLRARWGLSGSRIFQRTEEMLKKDIPVILCIPMMLLKKDKEDKLSLFVRTLEDKGEAYHYHKAAGVNAHYVMITGIVKEQEQTYFAVSSWGKEYYINFEEYDTYIHTHFLGKILGNILYIR